MAGIDIPIPELQAVVHVPTIKEIAYMGESKFFAAIQYLCLNKESLIQDETILSSLTKKVFLLSLTILYFIGFNKYLYNEFSLNERCMLS